MDLYEYIWTNRMSQTEFSKRTGIALPLINSLYLKKSTPNLKTAYKIFRFTDGDVTLEELVSPKDKKEIDNSCRPLKEDGL